MFETLSYIFGILVLVVGLALSIGLHEFGHLIPAKLFGVRVPHWAIGFGPKLFGKKIGETEYSVRLIPLGGFITLIGMYPPAKAGKSDSKRWFSQSIISARTAHSEHEQPGDENRKFYQLSAIKRITVMFGGPLTNLILGVTLMMVAFSGIGVTQRINTIDSVIGCTEQMIDSEHVCKASDTVSPAIESGLMVGDRIVEVDGRSFGATEPLADAISTIESHELTVMRGQQELKISVTPKLADLPYLENGKIAVDASGTVLLKPRAYIGVGWASGREGVSLDKSFGQAMAITGDTFAMLLEFPQQVYGAVSSLVTGEPRDQNSVVSIVGVGQVAGQVSASGSVDDADRWVMYLNLLGSLNLALFAFNMIPLPPLDGGHIAGGIYEYIKRGYVRIIGRKDQPTVDTALMAPLATFMFLVLLLAGVLMIVVDIVNPIRF